MKRGVPQRYSLRVVAVSVGEEAYIALDKGAISNTHVLVVPIDHARCSSELSASAFGDVDRHGQHEASRRLHEDDLRNLSCCTFHGKCDATPLFTHLCTEKGLQLIAFERFLVLRKSGGGGNHAHINVIGVPLAAAGDARESFESALAAAGLGEFTAIEAGATPAESQTKLRSVLTPPAGSSFTPEYFQVLLPGGIRLVKVIQRGERFPLNLGRERLAGQQDCLQPTITTETAAVLLGTLFYLVLAKLAGCSERADWKQCTRSEQEVAAAADAFKAMFAPHDPAAS
eukprot:357773-Chlamydomonas_euryale.AAC.8